MKQLSVCVETDQTWEAQLVSIIFLAANIQIFMGKDLEREK